VHVATCRETAPWKRGGELEIGASLSDSHFRTWYDGALWMVKQSPEADGLDVQRAYQRGGERRNHGVEQRKRDGRAHTAKESLGESAFLVTIMCVSSSSGTAGSSRARIVGPPVVVSAAARPMFFFFVFFPRMPCRVASDTHQSPHGGNGIGVSDRLCLHSPYVTNANFLFTITFLHRSSADQRCRRAGREVPPRTSRARNLHTPDALTGVLDASVSGSHWTWPS